MPKVPYNKRPDGRYYKQVVIGRDVNGKRKVKTLYDRDWKKLDKKVREFQTGFTQGIYIEEDITFGECAELWFESKVNIADSTKRQYKTYMNYFSHINHMKIKQIKPIHIQNIFNGLTARGIISTQKNLRGIFLKQLYKFAINNNFANVDLSDKIVIKKNTNNKRRALYQWEREGILSFLNIQNPSRQILKYQAITALLFYTGIRAGELLSLNLKRDISLERNTITINHTTIMDENYKAVEKQGTKTRSINDGRIVPIPPQLRKIIERYIKEYNITDYLFLTRNNTLIGGEYLSAIWKSIRKKISLYIPNHPHMEITPHYLRHNYATELIYANVPLKTVQYLMGHKDIQMTMNIYADVRKDDEGVNEMVRMIWN